MKPAAALLQLACAARVAAFRVPLAGGAARRHLSRTARPHLSAAALTRRWSSAASSPEVERLTGAVAAAGDKVRALKADGADKPAVAAGVAALLALKAELAAAGGGPPPAAAPAKKEKKKKKPPPASDAPAAPRVSLAAVGDGTAAPFGDLDRAMSRGETGRAFAPDAAALSPGDTVWLRARVAAVRGKGNSCFLVLRQPPSTTVQACYFKDADNVDESKAFLKYLQRLPEESVVDVQCTVSAADVKSCSVGAYELQLTRCHCVSRSRPNLPFSPEDAARSEAEIDASLDSERPFPRLGQDLRLNNRWIDLRAAPNNAMLRVQAGVCRLFRDALHARGFVEIHSPKLVGGGAEGGADVFTTDYFGQPACLAQVSRAPSLSMSPWCRRRVDDSAPPRPPLTLPLPPQSPQLFKQMAIASDIPKVFEVAPVFRAENSNTKRHLCEFTGLDMEMQINEHYYEAVRVVHETLAHIFRGLETDYADELAAVREQFPSTPLRIEDEPVIVHWDDAMQMLEDDGRPDVDRNGDIASANELRLGELVAEKYGVDIFVLDQFPAVVRPFYTMPAPGDGDEGASAADVAKARLCNSYDIIMRGQEISSGAQRCHEPEVLVEILRAKGLLEDGEVPEALEDYMESFEYGMPPHAGAGLGLERVVALYLEVGSVRKTSLFPRTPSRCRP